MTASIAYRRLSATHIDLSHTRLKAAGTRYRSPSTRWVRDEYTIAIGVETPPAGAAERDPEIRMSGGDVEGRSGPLATGCALSAEAWTRILLIANLNVACALPGESSRKRSARARDAGPDALFAARLSYTLAPVATLAAPVAAPGGP